MLDGSMRLEPMTMGQLLDRAFRVFRSHFWVLVGITAVLQIISFVFQLGVQFFSVSANSQLISGTPDELFNNPGLFLGAIAGGIIGFVVTLAMSLLTSAALSKTIGSAYLGEKLGVVEAFQAVLPRFGHLLAYLGIAFLLGIAFVIWIIIPCVGWFTGPGMLLAFSVVGTIGIPILILEERPAWESITRAWSLIRRRYWWVIGFFLLVTVLTSVISAGPSALIGLGGQAMLPTFPSVSEQMAVSSVQLVVTAILNTVVVPFSTIAFILMYFDLRIRTEGFDLAVDAVEADQKATPAALLQMQLPGKIGLQVVGEDWLNFFLSTLVFVAIYAVLIGVFAALGLAFLGI